MHETLSATPLFENDGAANEIESNQKAAMFRTKLENFPQKKCIMIEKSTEVINSFKAFQAATAKESYQKKTLTTWSWN